MNILNNELISLCPINNLVLFVIKVSDILYLFNKLFDFHNIRKDAGKYR